MNSALKPYRNASMVLAALVVSLSTACASRCPPGRELRDGLCHAPEEAATDAGNDTVAVIDSGAAKPVTRKEAPVADAGVSEALEDAAVKNMPERDAGTSAAKDAATMGPVCGDGIREGTELCDGADCKTDCKSENACIVSQLVGSAKTCDAQCKATEITTCTGGDGCCPSGCNHGTDLDCSASCGDGVLTGSETCEPSSAEHPCPTRASCNDDDPCTEDMITGTSEQCSAKCTHVPITTASSGDMCCPAGANEKTDSDCKPKCGNGVVETGELCDGTCPTSCEGGDSCTTKKLVGSAAQCNAECRETNNSTPQWYFADCDRDGYAPQSTGIQACAEPPAMAGCDWIHKQPLGNDVDCDDHSATRHPGVVDFGLPIQPGGGGLPPARDFAYDLNCDGRQEFTTERAVEASSGFKPIQTCSGSPTCGSGPDCIASFQFMGDIVCGQPYGVMTLCGGEVDVYWLCR